MQSYFFKKKMKRRKNYCLLYDLTRTYKYEGVIFFSLFVFLTYGVFEYQNTKHKTCLGHSLCHHYYYVTAQSSDCCGACRIGIHNT